MTSTLRAAIVHTSWGDVKVDFSLQPRAIIVASGHIGMRGVRAPSATDRPFRYTGRRAFVCWEAIDMTNMNTNTTATEETKRPVPAWVGIVVVLLCLIGG